MDIEPRLETESRRRRGRLLFRHTRVPVRMLVPNLFTLAGLCAGLTSIRMSIEARWELALAAIVFAALIDGLDGRVARLLKASSRFGAELDSLADFVNFGVAPAILLFTWANQGGEPRSMLWICVMIFALASALRLARFNVASGEDKPRWQQDYFTGVPTPAAAIVVLLPYDLAHLGLYDRTWSGLPAMAGAHALLLALAMVSNLPTYSGKLLGERIRRELVLPLFVLAMGLVALLVTYPYGTLAGLSLAYLLSLPWSWRRFVVRTRSEAAAATVPPSTKADDSRVVDIRAGDIRR